MNVAIVMPCFNDAEVAREVALDVLMELEKKRIEGRVILVDDGSSPRISVSEGDDSISVLRLVKNLGHQRAIACGLCYLADSPIPPGVVVVMDSDGEDEPADVLRLVESAAGAQPASVVFAQRRRRSEGVFFVLAYQAYLAVHRVLVGRAPKVGNFSAFPFRLLAGLVVDGDLWNHYAATVWKSRLSVLQIPTDRGIRRRGKSRMNLVALVSHGIAAVSCYRETIATRLVLGAGGLFAGGMVVLAICWLASFGAPGFWSVPLSLTVGLFVGTALWGGMLSLFFALIIHQGRNVGTVVPLRDYRLFLEETNAERPASNDSNV